MPRDIRLADRLKRGRLPARRLVLVDDHRSYALVEVVAAHDARDYAEFDAHARFEIELPPAPQLRQRDLDTRRRFGSDQGCGGVGKCRIRAILRCTILTRKRVE